MLDGVLKRDILATTQETNAIIMPTITTEIDFAGLDFESNTYQDFVSLDI